MDPDLQNLAALMRARNAIEIPITQIIGRPAERGNIGEFIASRVFDIELHELAVHPGSDGHFKSGPLAGKSVNIKTYGKREGYLDIRPNPKHRPNYYLVLTGPKSTGRSSKGTTRPWVINEVFLFAAEPLVSQLREWGVKLGVAAYVRTAVWEFARIYPVADKSTLKLTNVQQDHIRLFADR